MPVLMKWGGCAPVATLHRTLNTPVAIIVPDTRTRVKPSQRLLKGFHNDRGSQISEDAVLVLKVALVGSPLTHGEYPSSPRKGGRAAHHLRPQHSDGGPEIAATVCSAALGELA